MTNQEAIEVIKGEKKSLQENPVLIVNSVLYEAFDMAIKALEQESSGDLISRQELLEDLYKRDYTKFTHRDFVALVQYQDTVQQEPKTGYWIKYDKEYFTIKRLTPVTHSIRECSECHTKIADFCGEMRYCPNCRCRMESEDKE